VRDNREAPTAIRVLESATADNFFQDGYLLANADVARIVGREPAAAHLRDHGIREGRRQVTRQFIETRSEYERRKFSRFRGLLSDSYVHANQSDRFPVFFSPNHFTIDDYPRDSANGYFGPFAEAIESSPQGNFLDIGCGLRDVIYENCLYLDVYPSLTTDVVVAPDCLYPLASAAFDGISCCAVLEHVTKPWVVVDEIHRLLKTGGRCYIDWPFLQPVHGYPSHFYNATRQGLKNMFADRFEIERLWTHDYQTPDFSLVWIAGRFASYLDGAMLARFRQTPMGEILDHPAGDPFWRQFIQTLPETAIEELACGNSLIAAKR
jgi:SAM-dependent methyltransferase